MTSDVVLLPKDLRPEHLSGRAVVVLDVLRATTTMAAALAAGVKEIRIFAELDAAIAAARSFKAPHLLCGERDAVKPPGFDLGNSPGAFQRDVHDNATLFMTTTNGTKAILAATGAEVILIGALVNADAVAQALWRIGLDVTFLCAGTDGSVSGEDLLGAGAVIDRLAALTVVEPASDAVRVARRLFRAERTHLYETLCSSQGGHNVARAGLAPDIAFAANFNSLDVVGVVEGEPPGVRRWNPPS